MKLPPILPRLARALALLPLLAFGRPLQADNRIAVACIGEQTTHSFHRQNDPEYPQLLGELLDADFTVDPGAVHPMAGGFLTGGGTHYRLGNFGHPRGTVIDHGLENPKAILRSDELRLAEMFAPDILVLGPFGDHESQTKESLDRFTPDLRRLLDRIAAFPHPPVVLLALPIPRAHQDTDENYRRIRDETARLATERKLRVIDLWTDFLPHPEFYQDATHLTVPGRRHLATVVADAVKSALGERSASAKQ